MLRSLLETLERSHKLNPVGVRTERCTHRLSGKSRCERCVRHCPTGAITAPERPDSSRCVRCGACVEHCPTEVFEMQHSSAGSLQRRLASVLERYQSVVLCCEKGSARERRREDALVLTCLARLPLAELIPRLLNRDAAEVRVALPAACDDCVARPAMREKLAEVSRLSTLLRTSDPSGRRAGAVAVFGPGSRLPAPVSAPVPAPEARAAGKPAGKSARRRGKTRTAGRAVDPTRRDLLIAARTLPAHSTVARLLFGMELPRTAEAQPARNGALRGRLALRGARRAADELLRSSAFPAFFFPSAPRALVSNTCTLCNACSSICPTAALQRGRDGAVEYLTHDPQHCLNCGVCVELCGPQAIVLEHAARDATLTRVLERSEQACAACGRNFLPKSNGQYCRGCRTRRVLHDAETASASGGVQ